MNDSEEHSSPRQGDDHISKTVRKREAEALQALGLRLTKLKPVQLESLNLPDNIFKSINDYNRFPSREAKRRQLQYVGKLMRSADIDSIQKALDALDGSSNLAQYQHAQAELWRERLIAEPHALSEYINTYPAVDRQKIRQLIKKTQSAHTEEQRKTASRALFRFIHDVERDQ